MKRAILNYSGSIGKTTIAAHLLYPRMPGAAFFAIESINQSALDLGIA
ncbi:StdB protein, partial [Pseudomonas kurunegalensis]|nr:StdB protein [Pseudomonas kurunegalensis]